MAINRRQFLRRSAITAVGLGFGSPLLERVAWGRAPRGARGSLSNKVVVTLNLYGGNDGMNTVIPLNQYARYRELRPKIGIDQDKVLQLANAPDFGLNPGMTALHDLYGRGKVAVITGVGLPADARGLFDHEASQYVFQTADVSESTFTTVPTGWLGRYLDTESIGLVSPGVDLGGGNLMLTGVTREALTISSIDQFQVQPSFDGDARLAAYTDIMNIPNPDGGVAERNRLVRKDAIVQSEVVRDRTAGYTPAVEYPADNYLAQTLLQTAQLISADLGIRAIAVGTDGYDTHSAQNDGAGNGQLGYHDYLLNTVSEAVSAFYADLESHGLADDVIIVTLSEFGRRPEENNDEGTDHGFGSVGFVIGGAVRGGVYGGYASLAEEALVLDGNIDVTTDFRSVYATVLAGFTDADPAPILGGSFPLLGFL